MRGKVCKCYALHKTIEDNKCYSVRKIKRCSQAPNLALYTNINYLKNDFVGAVYRGKCCGISLCMQNKSKFTFLPLLQLLYVSTSCSIVETVQTKEKLGLGNDCSESKKEKWEFPWREALRLH